MKKLFLVILVWIGFLVTVLEAYPANAQGPTPSGAQVGVPWTGASGITETIEQIMQRERRAPQVAAASPRAIRSRRSLPNLQNRSTPAPNLPQFFSPQSPAQTRLPLAPRNPQPVGTSFLGAQYSESSNLVPPDSMGAVGPTQALVVVNGRIKAFDKSGVTITLNSDLTTFFAPSLGPSHTLAFDPQTRYDRLSGRWFVTALDDGDGFPDALHNRVMIAVSSGSTITTTSSFTFFQFQNDLVGATPNPDTDKSADYDSLGVDENSLYVGINVFAANPSDNSTTGFVLNKSDLLTGTLTVTAFRALGVCNPACSDGPFSPRGVQNDDPAATEGYFIGADLNSVNLLTLRRVTYSGVTPSISANIFVTLPSTYFPMFGVPAKGSATSLDDLDNRLFAAQIHQNKISGVNSLWTAHNIRVNSSGVSSAGGDRDAARWYELRNLTTTPSLYQYGALFDSAGSNPRFYWIPSVAMSGQGHIALGSSFASVNDFPGIAVAGRFFSDTLGTIQSPTIAQTGGGAYNLGGANPQRWGDYSQTVVDPTDDMTMWTFQEYANATNSWAVRVMRLKAPAPAFPLYTSPVTVSTGLSSVSLVLTGASLTGTGFFDPGADSGGPGFSNHITATVSGGVSVNSITFNSPTQVTLDISTASAGAGHSNITVTNPDGQSSTAYCILTVTDGVTSLPPCRFYMPLVYK